MKKLVCLKMTRKDISALLQFVLIYLHWEIPCQIDVGFILVHPDFGHTKGVSSSVEGDVTVVRLFCSSNMGHSGTGQNFHAASTQPNLAFQKTHQKQTFLNVCFILKLSGLSLAISALL